MLSSGRLLSVGGSLFGAGVVIAVGWLVYVDQDHISFWSWLGILGVVIGRLGLIILVAGWVIPDKNEGEITPLVKQVQRGGNLSTNYQAGRDIKIDKDKG
jgi:hypothetical protein